MASNIQELLNLIDSTIRHKTKPNTITVDQHSDLLYEIVNFFGQFTGSTNITELTTTSGTGGWDSIDNISGGTSLVPKTTSGNIIGSPTNRIDTIYMASTIDVAPGSELTINFGSNNNKIVIGEVDGVPTLEFRDRTTNELVLSRFQNTLQGVNSTPFGDAMTINPGEILVVSGDFTVKSGSSLIVNGGGLDISGDLIVEVGAALILSDNVILTADIINDGAITVEGNIIVPNGITLTNNGEVTVEDDFTNEGTTINEGTITVNGGDFINNGVLELGEDSELNVP